MKKLIVVFMFIVFCLVSCKDFTSSRDKLEKTQKEMEKNSLESIPIPIVSYFQEKRTIAKWSERWDNVFNNIRVVFDDDNKLGFEYIYR